MPRGSDRPPPHALPLAQALRELSGIAFDQACVRRDLLHSCTAGADWRYAWQRIRDRHADRVLARLRRGELASGGYAGSLAGRWCGLPAALWLRVLVLDEELGEIGEVLPSGGVRHLYCGVRVWERTPALLGSRRRYCSAARLRTALTQAAKGSPLTCTDAERIGKELGASRAASRTAWREMAPAELRRPGRRRK
jgi:hypothetical protein